ncbi:MAG: hypothetical protein ABJL18_03705 [Hyphomicrobiales bacterium]
MKYLSLIFSKKFFGKKCVFSILTAFLVSFFVFAAPQNAEACEFFIPDKNGNAIKGPSFDAMTDGFTSGLLECGNETHRLMVITIDVDTSQEHIGVRDDPLFSTDVTGELEALRDVAVSDTSNVHIMSRVNQSPFIGVHRGYVHFATLCDIQNEATPLNCSWGKSRIKFRSTILDTDLDQIVDRSYHELSVYSGDGRLYMISFWTPHRSKISSTTADWISALQAFGLDITKAG